MATAPKSVTVKHIFGETTIPAPPKRVVSAGFTEQDDLLAVGVVPIAVTNWFGDQPFGVWPWATSKLGGRPTRSAQSGQRNSGRSDRRAQTRPHRRRQRRPRRRHLPEAVRDRADHRAVRPATPSSNRGRTRPPRSAGGLPGRRDEAARSRASTTSSPTSAKNNPQFKDKKALLLAGTLRRRHADRDAARLAHRLPDRDGVADPDSIRLRRRRPPRRHPPRQDRRRSRRR